MLGICEPTGEIDYATAPMFRAALRAAIDGAPDAMVVADCSGVQFMDSSAYHALVDTHEYAIEHGHVLMIRNLRPQCAKVLRLCDLDDCLTIE